MRCKDDSKIIKIEPPRVENPKAEAPNTNSILDNALESAGLKRDSGGSA